MVGETRSAGYCAICDRMVERADGGACPLGHPSAAVFGRVPLSDGEPVPSLPRFNWAAFALPPIWGIAHGDLAGFFFMPIWLFADSAVASYRVSPLTKAMAIAVVVLTLAFQAFYAKRANGLAWRRVCDRMSVEQFAKRQRAWAIACVPVGAALVGWAISHRF